MSINIISMCHTITTLFNYSCVDYDKVNTYS